MSKKARWWLTAAILAVAMLVAAIPALTTIIGSSDPRRAPEPRRNDRQSQQLDNARRQSALPACEPAGTGRPPQQLVGVMATCAATGKDADVGKLVGSGPVLINVWASWCAPCRRELPALMRYSQRDTAIPVLLVQVKSSQRDGLQLLDQLGVRLPAVHDRGRLQRALEVPPALPTSYLVAQGSVQRFDPVVFDDADQVADAVAGSLPGGEASGRGSSG